MKKYIVFSVLAALIFSGCEDLFEPALVNYKDPSQMYEEPSYAQGFLVNAYRSIPSAYDNSEYATDDAVTNQKTNGFLMMATGSWTAANNPVDQWVNAYGAIQYVNLFLENAHKVTWAKDPEANKLFGIRMRGEAFGLRALYHYYLLRAHAGYDEDNRLMGVPLLLKFQDANANYNVGRASFDACVKQIYQDLDSAEAYLPLEYVDLANDNDIPERFKSVVTTAEVYNRVMGIYARQLFNGLIAKSFRARTALLAASPAFQDATNPATWEMAANHAAAVLNYNGGLTGLDPKGHTFYTNTAEIDALKEGINPKEIIWRENISATNSTQEDQNFPPSLRGTGFMNPTKNLVDAFPMLNGYPVNDPASGYNPDAPFTGRDPRLAHYIIYNGSTAGTTNSVINTGSDVVSNDGINKTPTSTRTGFYMKKRLRMDVNSDPSSKQGKPHYIPRIRYTEMFLAYAEAANEAWGPQGTGGQTYSAYDVIKLIRNRAGIGKNNEDAYLDVAASDKDKMRDLIRNERRLELCFEGVRFWDLRRWKLNLNETAKGLDITANGISVINVEERDYKDYMYYGPIPNSELLKYDDLKQNRGWK